MFAPRDARQKCCSKPCGVSLYEKTPRRRELTRKAYAVKAKTVSAKRRERYQKDTAYRAKTLEHRKDYFQRNRETVLRKATEWRDTPERRAEAAAASRAWHAVNKEHANPRRKERIAVQRTTYPWQTLIHSAKARAAKQGLPFDLTDEWGANTWTGVCALTKLPFMLGIRRPVSRTFAPSIDKIIPSLGYVRGNCRFVLWAVNAFKYDGTDDDMYRVAEALILCRPKSSTESRDRQ